MKLTQIMLLVLGIAGASLVSPLAQAHSDDYMDALQAPNGGKLRMAGPYHYELVVATDGGADIDTPVFVYVTDHAGTKISTTAASGTVTIGSGKRKRRLQLMPDGDNRMKGRAPLSIAPGVSIAVSVKLAGKATEQAIFKR